MIDNKLIISATEIILDRILTPVLYLYSDEALEFICFCDSKTSEEDFRDAESAIYLNLGIKAELTDIRTFDEDERVQVTKYATLVYAESEMVKMLFEAAMLADRNRMESFNLDTLARKNDTGTYYIN